MEACDVGNLGSHAQTVRLRGGIAGLALGLILAVLLVHFGVSPLYRSLLFVPFFGGAFGAYQGLFRTCTGAAARGERITDQGVERVIDRDQAQRSKADARLVLLGSAATALVATTLVVLAPG